MSEEKSAAEAGSSLNRRQFVIGSAAGVLAAGTLVPGLARALTGPPGKLFSIADGYDLWKFEALLDERFYMVDMSTYAYRIVTLVDLVVHSEAPDQFQTVFQDRVFDPMPEDIFYMFNADAGLFQMRLSPGGEGEGGCYYVGWVSLLDQTQD